MELKDQVAVITGGGSGIGAATAKLFAEQGARVVLADRDEAAAAAQLETIEAAGGSGMALACEVSRQEDLRRVTDEAVSAYGRLDIMINNAGITRPSATLEVDAELWDNVMEVNLRGVFWGCQAAFRHMKEAGYGRIVSTSSTSSLGSFKNASYAVTKAGVVAMTRSLAMEFGKYGVTVNAVGPGLMETPMVANASEAFREKWIRKTVVGRIGEPIDVARAFLFLASPGSSYITGQMLFVDGGYTLPTMKG